MLSLPNVSIIIPMRNEAKHIQGCLQSIHQSQYPHERLEVLIVDGQSTDTSVPLVKQFIGEHPHLKIRLIHNEKQTVPFGLNLAIRNAQGDIIIRMDVHTRYDPDYISVCVELLQNGVAENVGGVQRAQGDSWISEAIALAFSHQFVAGDAAYRYSKRDQYVDTVFLGAWKRETLEKLKGFDITCTVNQDYELNYRLRQMGGRVFLSQKIRCTYIPRESYLKLFQQYFRYGLWKVKILSEHPDSLRWRQLVSPIFVIGLVVSLISLPLSAISSLLLPLTYGVINALASMHACRLHQLWLMPFVFLAFLTMHTAWGIGFWLGLGHFGLPQLRPKHLIKALSRI